MWNASFFMIVFSLRRDGLAAELARAEGIPVETVVVADDVALRDGTVAMPAEEVAFDADDTDFPAEASR